MSPITYTEDTLVQQTTAENLQQQLGGESIYAYNNEDFGPDSLLGCASDREKHKLTNGDIIYYEWDCIHQSRLRPRNIG